MTVIIKITISYNLSVATFQISMIKANLLLFILQTKSQCQTIVLSCKRLCLYDKERCSKL